MVYLPTTQATQTPGPNNLINFPVITSGITGSGNTVITGTIDMVATAAAYTVELFGNTVANSTGYGEGQTYLGNVTVNTDANGHGAFSAMVVGIPNKISATVTDAANNTSEFAAAVTTHPPSTITTTGTLTALNTTYGTASANASISVGGVGLTADIAIAAPAGFEISTDENTGFANNIMLAQTAGTVNSNIFIRAKANNIVGTYSGNITLTSTGATTINLPTVASTVAAKPITVTAVAKSKVYGDTDPELSYTLTTGALIGSDDFTGSITRIAGENAGNYNITQGNLALSTNYAVTYVGANFTIKKGTITGVTLADGTFSYDGNPQSLTVANLPAGATVSYSGNGQINAGSFSVRATISKPNYDDLELVAVISVNNATLSGITLADATYIYNGTPKTLVAAHVPAGATVSYNGNGQTNAGHLFCNSNN